MEAAGSREPRAPFRSESPAAAPPKVAGTWEGLRGRGSRAVPARQRAAEAGSPLGEPGPVLEAEPREAASREVQRAEVVRSARIPAG